MSKREAIAARIVESIDEVRYVKTVTREPRALTELSRQAYPHVLVESANEVRDIASFGETVRHVADIDFLINCVVYGENRDQQRNLLLQAIEEKLQSDATLAGLVYDSYVTQIQIREIEEADPYATAAMIYTVRYYYDRAQP